MAYTDIYGPGTAQIPDQGPGPAQNFLTQLLAMGLDPATAAKNQEDQQKRADYLAAYQAGDAAQNAPAVSPLMSLLAPKPITQLPPVENAQAGPQITLLPPVPAPHGPEVPVNVAPETSAPISPLASDTTPGPSVPWTAPQTDEQIKSTLSKAISQASNNPQAALPHPSTMDTAIGLLASLAGGGGSIQGTLAAGGEVGGFQQQEATNNALIQQQLTMNGPAAEMRHNQQNVYQARMQGDINRFMQAKAQDVNGAISDGEWERGWQQIRAQYAPLGLDPGPSPYEVSWEASKQASPEFRNASILKGVREDYDDSTADLAGTLLSADPSGKALADYMLKLKSIDAMQGKTNQKQQLKQEDMLRKRNIERLRAIGANAQQIKYDPNVGGKVFDPVLMQGLTAVDSYYDRRAAQIQAGQAPSGPSDIVEDAYPQIVPASGLHSGLVSFMGGTSPGQQQPLKPEDFHGIVNQLQQRARNVHSPVPASPQAVAPTASSVTANNIDGPIFYDVNDTAPKILKSQLARAINLDSPQNAAQAKAQANATGKALLSIKGGVPGFVYPDYNSENQRNEIF